MSAMIFSSSRVTLVKLPSYVTVPDHKSRNFLKRVPGGFCLGWSFTVGEQGFNCTITITFLLFCSLLFLPSEISPHRKSS